ncbi:MAG: GNAT family N-acetyltransferase [Patescibacteria group bacterium]
MKNNIKQKNIKIITIDNVEQILKLYPEANKERLAKIKFDVSNDIDNARKRDRIIFGLKKGNEVVGTAQLVFKDKKKFYADGKIKAHIHHVRVMENLRGKGLGSQLMRHIEVEAIKKGFGEITLGVEEDNKRAVIFYKKIGFQEFMKEKGDEGEIIIGMKKIIAN